MQAFHKNDSFMSKSDSNEKYYNSEYSTFYQDELFDETADFLKKKSVSMDFGLPDLLDDNNESICDQTAPVLSFDKLSGQRMGEISEFIL